ncbi:MAG TPA: hypothetical protein VI112_00695 [Bacteroidia bacterium]|jgi:hypothetical protein
MSRRSEIKKWYRETDPPARGENSAATGHFLKNWYLFAGVAIFSFLAIESFLALGGFYEDQHRQLVHDNRMLALELAGLTGLFISLAIYLRRLTKANLYARFMLTHILFDLLLLFFYADGLSPYATYHHDVPKVPEATLRVPAMLLGLQFLVLLWNLINPRKRKAKMPRTPHRIMVGLYAFGALAAMVLIFAALAVMASFDNFDIGPIFIKWDC